MAIWGTYPQILSLIVITPKRTVLGLNHAIKREYRLRGSSWALEEERTGGQDREGKKSQKGYISPICGEAPTEAIYIKNCVVGDILNVITYVKFQSEIVRLTVLEGVEFSSVIVFSSHDRDSTIGLYRVIYKS